MNSILFPWSLSCLLIACAKTGGWRTTSFSVSPQVCTVCCIPDIKKQFLAKYSPYLNLLIQLWLVQLLHLVAFALLLTGCTAVLQWSQNWHKTLPLHHQETMGRIWEIHRAWHSVISVLSVNEWSAVLRGLGYVNSTTSVVAEVCLRTRKTRRVQEQWRLCERIYSGWLMVGNASYCMG